MQTILFISNSKKLFRTKIIVSVKRVSLKNKVSKKNQGKSKIIKRILSFFYFFNLMIPYLPYNEHQKIFDFLFFIKCVFAKLFL